MPTDVPPPQSPKRAVIRQVAKKLQLPMVSGTGSVLLLLACFAISAVTVLLVGMALQMPPWLSEFRSDAPFLLIESSA